MEPVTASLRVAPASAADRAAVLALGDLRVLVESSDASHLTWLTEFLAPPFEPCVDVEHDCRVTLIEDQARHRAMLALGPLDGTLDAFALDTRVVSLPRWRGAETRLFDPKPQVFYEMTTPPHAVTILSTPANPGGRTALMRVVRELATNRAQRTGQLLLHAAAFAVGDRGVLVAGPKLAGKTTLLVHLLRSGRARYVSNDRVLLDLARTPPRARGVPTIVALRQGTLDLFPALSTALTGARLHHRLTIDEAARLTRGGDRLSNGPPGLSPAQLCEVLGVARLPECELGAVLFPCVTGERGALAVHRLDEAEAATRLAGALFGLPPGRWVSDVFAIPADPPAPDLAARLATCRSLAGRAPCFECRLGLGAFESPRTAEDLIASVLGPC
jgi:hypothetical protein